MDCDEASPGKDGSVYNLASQQMKKHDQIFTKHQSKLVEEKTQPEESKALTCPPAPKLRKLKDPIDLNGLRQRSQESLMQE